MRAQVRITLPERARRAIDAARLRWNREVAADNPAHVTVVYHDEVPDVELLRARLERVCRSIAFFPLRLGAVERFAPPDIGAFLAVDDPESAVRRLREAVLASPFTPRTRFGLHVTLLHPSYGARLAEAWPELSQLETGGAFVAERIDLVAGAGSATEKLASFPLCGEAI